MIVGGHWAAQSAGHACYKAINPGVWGRAPFNVFPCFERPPKASLRSCQQGKRAQRVHAIGSRLSPGRVFRFQFTTYESGVAKSEALPHGENSLHSGSLGIPERLETLLLQFLPPTQWPDKDDQLSRCSGSGGLTTGVLSNDSFA